MKNFVLSTARHSRDLLAQSRLGQIRAFLLVFLTVVAAILFGLAWSERAMRHVVDEGYATIAQITSAQTTGRRFPFVFDGWRTRWVDQSNSVTLNWTGMDGVERSRRGIAVSDAFTARYLTGASARAISIRARVIDDDSSLPVIEEDYKDRLRHLREFHDVALAGLVLFGCAFLFSLAWKVGDVKDGSSRTLETAHRCGNYARARRS